MRGLISFRKMRVIWVSPSTLDAFLHNAAFFHILGQFAELGHKVTFLAVRSKNVPRFDNRKVRLIAFPLRYVPLVSSVMFAIAMSLFLPIFILVSKSDLVILSPDVSILSSLLGLFVSKFRKVKFVLDIRSVPVEMVGFRGYLQKFWFPVSVLIAKRLFDGITIITPSMKKEVCNYFDVDPGKVGVWTSGVSDSLFNPENPTIRREALRRNLGLAEKFILFYHGTFSSTRGLTETIEAIKILKNKYHDIVFFLLGTGPTVATLRALIRKEDLLENVIIHNPVDQSEVPKFIDMCDVCIVPLPNHPYWRHQSPLKLLEYLAMEKVVILTDIPAHRSIVGDADCGLYISSVSPTEIARVIEYAYFNKENLGERGKIGRRIIKEKYTWKKVARDLENYLLSISERTDLV